MGAAHLLLNGCRGIAICLAWYFTLGVMSLRRCCRYLDTQLLAAGVVLVRAHFVVAR